MGGWYYNLYRSLVFETKLGASGDVFHLLDRCWYRAKAAFVERLQQDLDDNWIASPFPAFAHASEGDYTIALAKEHEGFVCLDKTNVAPKAMSMVEPCDLLMVEKGKAVLVHIKVGTFSFKLSHLFSQGATAVELLRESDAALTKLKRLINEHAAIDHIHAMTKAVDRRRFAVIYAIVSHKEEVGKSQNLPLFSRITLRRAISALRALDAEAKFCFVKTAAPVKKVAPAKKTTGPSTAPSL